MCCRSHTTCLTSCACQTVKASWAGQIQHQSKLLDDLLHVCGVYGHRAVQCSHAKMQGKGQCTAGPLVNDTILKQTNLEPLPPPDNSKMAPSRWDTQKPSRPLQCPVTADGLPATLNDASVQASAHTSSIRSSYKNSSANGSKKRETQTHTDYMQAQQGDPHLHRVRPWWLKFVSWTVSARVTCLDNVTKPSCRPAKHAR